MRWRRLPPIEAMLRSCSEAPSSSACEIAGIALDHRRRRGRRRSCAPARRCAARRPGGRSTPVSGRSLMSTRWSLCAMPARMRSTSVVPPARNALPGSPRGERDRLLDRRGAAVAQRPHAPPSSRTSPDRRADVRVRGAAADVAAHELGDVLVGGGVALLEQLDGGHDLPGRAVAALERVVLDERLLHRVQLAAGARGPRSWSPRGLRRRPRASGRRARGGRRPRRCRRRTCPGRSPSWCR